MIESNYSVYMFVFPNKKIYIGMTGRRPALRWGRGKAYSRMQVSKAIDKFGWERIKTTILISGLTVEEASKKEAEFINSFRSSEKEFGYNRRHGGEYVVREKSTKKMPENSATPRKKCKNIIDGKTVLSDWQKEKLKVVQIDYETNSIIKVWDSVYEAYMDLDLSDSGIQKCCRGAVPMAGGWKWQYVISHENHIIFIKNIRNKI